MIRELVKCLTGVCRLNVIVTANCNSRCAMCNAWLTRSEDLPTSFYLELAEQAGELGIPIVHITGGEPTLRPDLWEIVEAFWSNGAYLVELATNGLVPLDPPDGGRLAIGVSIDGVKEVYRRVRGLDAFDRVFSNYLRLRDLSRERRGLIVHISYTINSINAGRMEEFLEFLASEGIDAGEVSVSVEQGGLLFGRDFSLPSGEFVSKAISDLRKYSEALRHSHASGLLGRVRLAHLRTMVSVMISRLEDFSRGVVKPVRCSAGRRMFTVTPDGLLAPCNYLPGKADLRVMGLREAMRKVGRVGECSLPCLNFCDPITYMGMNKIGFLLNLMRTI